MVATQSVRVAIATLGAPEARKAEERPADPASDNGAAQDAEQAAAVPAPMVSRDPYAPEADDPTEFVTLAIVDGEAFCRSLENASLSEPAFHGGIGSLQGWTCVPEMLKPVEGEEAAVSSLFVTVRGDVPDRILSMRVKLNLVDPATAQRVRDTAKAVLTQMLGAFGGAPPQRVLQAIDFDTNVAVVERGVTYELKKEFNDTRRANLLIVFPQQLGEGGEDRFLERRRELSILPAFRP